MLVITPSKLASLIFGLSIGFVVLRLRCSTTPPFRPARLRPLGSALLLTPLLASLPVSGMTVVEFYCEADKIQYTFIYK